MKQSTKTNQKENTSNGITLIALVITIIVLLILAAVSISTLTGDNGILTKASNAKRETEEAAAREKVQMAVLASYGTDGTIDKIQLKSNLQKVEGIDVNTIPNSDTKDFPWEVTVDGYPVTINENGNVTVGDKTNGGTGNPTYNTATTVIEAKKQNVPYRSKTTITDAYNNSITIPEGFKIAQDSADDVTGGVVIEDATEEATKGSQFVWVPVGNISNATGTKTIELNRYNYTFSGEGQNRKYYFDPLGEDSYAGYYEELAESSYGNSTAKDINAFKTSASTNKGYYIGRYEARTKTERTNNTDDLGQLTVNSDDYVYNYVTQNQASALSQNMYKNKTFTSDLINSYVWDTTTLFISTYGNANYPSSISLNNSFANQGTNSLQNASQHDVQCNIWDMASNVAEWSTETHTYKYNDDECYGTLRGYTMNSYDSVMFNRSMSSWSLDIPLSGAVELHSFRVILYL